MIYLDHNATVPLLPQARDAWLAAQGEAWGNPASVHAAGQAARVRLDRDKARIAALLGARAHELVVTSGGTEANALAIHAACAGDGGGADGDPWSGILASAIEHSSVLRNAAALAGDGWRSLPVDSAGRLDPATVAAAITPTTRLVCVQFANNELGTLQDIPAIVAAVRMANPRALVLLDACQGAGKAPLHLRDLGVDLASVAGHKLGAPKGVGLLYAHSGVRIEPLLRGGRQQQDRRSGTEDAAGVAALAAALDHAIAHRADEAPRQRALLDRLWARIVADMPAARWLAHQAPRLPNTMSLAHPGVANDILVTRLDLAGFAVSTGAACMAGRGGPSHVIAALGIDPALARGAIRISIGPATTADELDAFAIAYGREVMAMRAG